MQKTQNIKPRLYIRAPKTRGCFVFGGIVILMDRKIKNNSNREL
jgi:hypothetical protein